jgi:hypothetical protein
MHLKVSWSCFNGSTRQRKESLISGGFIEIGPDHTTPTIALEEMCWLTTGVAEMKELPTISAKIAREEFFDRYIATRTPVKFFNQLQDQPWNVNSWTNQYLKDKAGNCLVKVEYRDTSDGRFGKGNEQTIKFGEFLDHHSSGDQRWYLTTQQLDYTAEGQPMIVSHPITDLLDDVPLRPHLMGHLIPQNINLWMGCSEQPTTSGLHHDFHDNIYILLRGQKTFTLYPPSEYRNMYLVGTVSHLHPNGRFNYQGQPTRADGSCIGSEEALRASKLLDEAVLKLENEVCFPSKLSHSLPLS